MTGVEEAAVVRVLHVNLNAVGAVVGKREQVGVRGIARTLPNPVRGDANGRVLVRLNMQGRTLASSTTTMHETSLRRAFMD